MSRCCQNCGSHELAKRGNGFRSRCAPCQAAYQREKYHANRETYIATRKRIYARNAEKRREESRITKANNRARYTLLEWFRRNGVSASDIPSEDLDALVAMKEAIQTRMTP